MRLTNEQLKSICFGALHFKEAEGGYLQAFTPQLLCKMGLLTKAVLSAAITVIAIKTDAAGRHPMHFIILLRFMAAAESRQWSSAAAIPRRVRRVKLCPRFWIAKVPSHHICRKRSAFLYSGVVRLWCSASLAAWK